MNFARIKAIYRKELVDALRDRRTIISTLVMPVLMFPLLTFGFGGMMAKAVTKMRAEKTVIMVLGRTHAPSVAAFLAQADGLTVEEGTPDYVERINQKKIRAAVQFPAGLEAALAQTSTHIPHVKIFHYAGEIRSQTALRNVQKALRDYRDQIVSRRLSAGGLPPEALRPFETDEENVAAPEKVGGSLFGGLIPYMIIFLTFVGALNPAMDLTAGEKERGTMETILASPVSKVDLVVGKFLMVFTASMTTAIVSIISFVGTFSMPFVAAREMSKMGSSPMPFDLSIAGVMAVFTLVVPLAIMFSAGLLAISLFAKSFKEAQSYVSPLMIVVILPAMAAMLPGFDLNLKLAFVPILNVSLVSKEVLTGSYPWTQIGIVLASSCVYAAAALAAAVSLFKRESVLFRA